MTIIDYEWYYDDKITAFKAVYQVRELRGVEQSSAYKLLSRFCTENTVRYQPTPTNFWPEIWTQDLRGCQASVLLLYPQGPYHGNSFPQAGVYSWLRSLKHDPVLGL